MVLVGFPYMEKKSRLRKVFKHLKIFLMDKQPTENEKRDHALYYVDHVDADFSPERNKAIIDRTIKKAELMRKKKMQNYVDSIRERSDAVATYLKSRTAEGRTPVERYFGKKNLAHLRGVQIRDILKAKLKGRETLIHLPTDIN